MERGHKRKVSSSMHMITIGVYACYGCFSCRGCTKVSLRALNSALDVAHRLSYTQLRVKSNWTKGGIVMADTIKMRVLERFVFFNKNKNTYTLAIKFAIRNLEL